MRPGRLLEPLLPRPETGGRLPRAAVGVTVGLALLGAVVLVLGQQLFGLSAGSGPGVGAATRSAANQVRGADGSYAFTLVQPSDPDRPVTWDPCRVIPVEVNDRLAPPGAGSVLNDALAEVGRASGLRFQMVGRTDRQPAGRRTGSVPRRQPALVVWTTPERLPELRGDIAGVGGSTARPAARTSELEYVTGVVALDAPQLEQVLARPGGEERTRAVVVHELAHLVGLDHVDDPEELMYADNVGRLELGPGDREGLAALGDGTCH